MVLVAVVGTGGLRPALAAIEAGKDLAVASKEILVMAGESSCVTLRQKALGSCLASEHNAIFLCLEGKRSTLNLQRSTSKSDNLTLNVEHCGRWTFLMFAGLPNSFRRPFPETPNEQFENITPRTGAQAPDVEHGPEDHDRFRHAIQQRLWK